jgi:hypothetical protein
MAVNKNTDRAITSAVKKNTATKATPIPYTPTAAELAASINYGTTTVNKPVTTGGNTTSTGITAAEQAALDAAAASTAASNRAALAAEQQAAQQAAIDAANRKDAFQLLTDTFNSYGLQDLASTIQQFMQENVGANEAALRLKTDTSINPVTKQAYNAPYVARFAGNVTRVANGLNALSEAQYLALEDQYSNLMTQYGTKGIANKAQFATLVGNDVSATELNSRLDLAVNQVQNADPQVLATLKSYYPSVSNGDLVSYFLAPNETLPQLQQQTTAAKIGTYATEQLTPGATTPEISQAHAMQLAQAGVTEAQAKAGYTAIGQELPIASKLATIYGASGINYDQTAAEAEQFGLTGAASAARAKQQLQELEKAQFAGRSGIAGASAAAGYTGSLGKSIQGKF